jgi:hypothetical protein
LAKAKQRENTRTQGAAKKTRNCNQAPTNGKPKPASKRSNGSAASALNGNGHRLSLPTVRSRHV